MLPDHRPPLEPSFWLAVALDFGLAGLLCAALCLVAAGWHWLEILTRR